MKTHKKYHDCVEEGHKLAIIRIYDCEKTDYVFSDMIRQQQKILRDDISKNFGEFDITKDSTRCKSSSYKQWNSAFAEHNLESVFPSDPNGDWTVIWECLRQRNLSGRCNLSQAL